MQQDAELQTKASLIIDLKATQRELAFKQRHADAKALGEKIAAHAEHLLQQHLGIDEFPVESPVSKALVRDIFLGLAAAGHNSVEARSLLRKAAWQGGDETIKRLERARAALPELEKVLAELRVK